MNTQDTFPEISAESATEFLKEIVEDNVVLPGDENGDFNRFLQHLAYILMSGADPNVKSDSTGNTFLHNVLSFSHINGNEELKLMKLCRLFLLSSRFDKYIVNNNGDAIIHKAAGIHCPYFLQLYLRRNGTDVNIQDRAKNTALRIVCNTGITSDGDTTPVQKMKLLLNAGANPNIANEQNFTPIFDVCYRLQSYVSNDVDPLPVIEMLLEAGANPNITIVNHAALDTKTCLHQLASYGGLRVSGQICTILLMKGGAKLNVKDRHGRTPLDVAELCDNIYVIDAINAFKQRNFFIGAMNHKRLAEGSSSRGLSDDVVGRILNLSLNSRHTGL